MVVDGWEASLAKGFRWWIKKFDCLNKLIKIFLKACVCVCVYAHDAMQRSKQVLIGLNAPTFSNLAVAYVDLFGSVSVACPDN